MEIFTVNENIYSMVFHPGLTREYVHTDKTYFHCYVTLTLSENIFAMEIHPALMKE